MTSREQSLQTIAGALPSQLGRSLGWNRLGIRQKILIPIIGITLLSALGSALLFLFTTNTTRDSILEGQISEESQRLQTALNARKEDAINAAELLARDEDPGAIRFLLTQPGTVIENETLDVSERVQPVRNRLGIDQIIVTNNMGDVRTNIAPSYLEAITVRRPDLLEPCNDTTSRLDTFAEHSLLIVCAPVRLTDDTIIGYVYSVLDLELQVENVSKQLELASDVRLTSIEPAVNQAPSFQQQFDSQVSTLFRTERMAFGDGLIDLSMALDAQEINEVVGAGLQTTLIGSGVTIVLLTLLGLWLATSFTRPILKLSSVAQAVAEGDLTQRANLTHNDEIGQLGRAFDKATGQIEQLLDHQARTAGERQAILQSIADGVLAVDKEERILVLNPAAANLLQQNPDEVIGKPLSELNVPQDPGMVVGLQQIVRQLRTELTDDDANITEDQIALGRRIVRLRSAPTMQHGTILTGAVVSIQDVTKAVELDRAKSEFIATASHELRTPLASLRGFVDVFLLTGTDNLNDAQRMYLDTIKRQTNNLTQLVNDLLEIARLDRGEERFERRWIEPATAIDGVLNGLSGFANQRNVQVSVEVQPDLTPIWFDAVHLRTILANLFSNAMKYVYQGGVVIIRAYAIKSSSELPAALLPPPFDLPWEYTNEESLLITVEDNGVGIREEDQPRIFERFFRSENPLSVEVGGTGLGLAITHELVKINHCQIGLRSREGEGSLFWLRIPTANTELLDNPDHPEGTYHDSIGTIIKEQEI